METIKTPIFFMFQNQKNWTEKSLEYLFKFTEEDEYELILINNGSSKKICSSIVSFCKENIDKFELVNYDKECGVSYAYMEAIRKYGLERNFVILHNDCFVTKDWLKILKEKEQFLSINEEVSFSCIFPRTNYSTEGTPSCFDNEIKKDFCEKKLSNKSFYTKEDISDNLDEVYYRHSSLEEYSEKIKAENSSKYKIVEEMCIFCTLFNYEAFSNAGGLDEDFIKKGCEAKLLNENLMGNNFYSIMALDCFVHHHGNLTTGGSGRDFSFDFDMSEKLLNEKRIKFLEERKSKVERFTKLSKGCLILIMREGGIGDIIMSMFAVESIKKMYPKTSISYMTDEKNMMFVKGFKCVDQVLPLNFNYNIEYEKKEKIKDFSNDEFVSRFDIIYNWIKSVEYFDKRDIHRIEKFLSFTEIEGLRPIKPEYNIENFSEKRMRHIDTMFLEKMETVAICCDATCKIRSFSKEVYEKIIELEAKKGKRVLVLGNNEALDMTKYNKNVIDLGFSLKIEELPYLIKKCDYIYTPDTGLFHIASLVGVKSKAFFGSINPDLRDGGYYGIQNAIYYKKELPCVPCRDMGCKEIPCMKYSEEQIMEIVEKNV